MSCRTVYHSPETHNSQTGVFSDKVKVPVDLPGPASVPQNQGLSTTTIFHFDLHTHGQSTWLVLNHAALCLMLSTMVLA